MIVRVLQTMSSAIGLESGVTEVTMLSGEMFSISRSSLYHVWVAERQEISRHKWFLSEAAGHDVGWDRATFDWNMRFRAEWIAGLKSSGVYPS